VSELAIKNASDADLEDVLRKAENTHISGSQFEKAKIELKIRRERELFELQKDILTSIQSRLDRIIRLLEFINNKPLWAILWASALAILIGVTVNVISHWITNRL